MNNILTNNGRDYQGTPITETKTYKLWESVGKSLVEAKLSPEQINQLFANLEQNITAGGGNRTVLGKGKDAWTDLKSKIYNSKPMANFAAAYDKAAEKLKQATGGDDGVFKYVQKYREFAKKHPIIQGAVYAALIAASGVATGGLGGAAALALLKSTDRMLQGDDIRTALWKGAKTGAMAYGASKLGDLIKGHGGASSAGGNADAPFGTDADGIPFSNASEASSYYSMNPSAPGAREFFAHQANQFQGAGSHVASAGGKSVSDFYTYDGKSFDMTQNSAYQEVIKRFPTGGPTAREMARKAAQHAIEKGDVSGKISDYATIFTNTPPSDMTKYLTDLAKAGYKAAIENGRLNIYDGSGKVVKMMAGMAPNPMTGSEGFDVPEMLQVFQAAAKTQEESRNLSIKQINKLFEGIALRSALMEGAGWDKFKSGIGQAIGGVIGGAKTVGHNLTTKVTADKLMSAWKKAGSPDDSTQIFDVLIKAGATRDVIEKTFTDMKIPLPGASTKTAKPKPAGAPKPAAGAKKATATAAQNKAMKRNPGDFAKPVGAKQAGPKPAAPAQPQQPNIPVAGVRTQGGTFAKKTPTV